MTSLNFEIIVIGGGAAGLMAAATAAKRGKRVLLIESTNKLGEKIRISGGGRCNFTNIHASPSNYLSNNPHFVKSALSRYTQHDFIKLVEEYQISYHEKTLGQLFCNHSSNQIIEMLITECKKNNVTFLLNTQITSIVKDAIFKIQSNERLYICDSLIIATGGLSIPKIGASSFGYDIAKQFDHSIIPTRPALVPLTVSEEKIEFFKNLSGISVDSIVSFHDTSFRENILFTHKGLSGPAILQISSYLPNKIGEIININLLPDTDIYTLLKEHKNSKISIANFIKQYLPNRFVDNYFDKNKRLVDLSNKNLEELAYKIKKFQIEINGTEGYLKAEVTSGGVNTTELSSKTMMSNKVSNLYFIGEVVDVTGWLGGYNFQWAWSSGYTAGSYA